MIMILLVTAYNGMWWHGRRQGYIQSYTQSYSKYFRQARVRTVRLASMPASSSCPAGVHACLLVTPCWWTRLLEAARSTRHQKQHGIACAIIE